MNALDNIASESELDSTDQSDLNENDEGNELESIPAFGRKSIFEKWQDKFKEFLDKA